MRLAHLRSLLPFLLVFAATAGNASAQLSSLTGSLGGNGDFSSTGAGGVTSTWSNDYAGRLNLSGMLYIASRRIAAIDFHFGLGAGYYSSTTGGMQISSASRSLNPYSVNGRFLSAMPVSFSVGTSLQLVDVSVPGGNQQLINSTGAYSGWTREEHATATMKMGRFGTLDLSGALSTQGYSGILGDTTFKSEQANFAYVSNGELGDSYSLRYTHYRDLSPAGEILSWNNSGDFYYGRSRGAGSMTLTGEFHDDRYSKVTLAQLFFGSRILTNIRRNNGLTAQYFLTSASKLGWLEYGDALTYYTQSMAGSTFSVDVGGRVGYQATYFSVGEKAGTMGREVTASGRGVVSYGFSIDTARAWHLSSSGSASALRMGAGVPVQANYNAASTLMWRGNGHFSGTANVSLATSSAATRNYSIGEGLSGTYSEGSTALSLAISQGNTRTMGSGVPGATTTVTSATRLVESASFNIDNIRGHVDIRGDQTWLNAQLATVHGGANFSVPQVLENLSLSLSYDADYTPSTRINIHRIALHAGWQWRAISMTLRYMYLRAQDVFTSSGTVTFSRPFRIL